MRRVCLLTSEFSPFSGGIGTYTIELARELALDGVSVLVIAPEYGRPDGSHHPFAVERLLGHHRFGLAQVWAVLRRLRSLEPGTIVHPVDIRTVLLVYLARMLGGRPYRVTIHGSEVSKFRRFRAAKPIVKRAYLGAEATLANSAATLAIHDEAFGRPRAARVTLLGVAPDRFGETAGGFEHGELARVAAEGAPFVCTVGRVEDRKGHLLAIKAIAEAKARAGADIAADIAYVVAGAAPDAAYGDEIDQCASAAGVRTVQTGAISPADLKRLFRASLCHLLPALAMPNKIEGFGLVLVEAAAQACPSVCTRVGGIPEAMGDPAPGEPPSQGRRPGGVVCEPDDVDALADAIVAYARDPGLRAHAGDQALAHARTFTWRRCAEGAYPEILTPSPPAPAGSTAR